MTMNEKSDSEDYCSASWWCLIAAERSFWAAAFSPRVACSCACVSPPHRPARESNVQARQGRTLVPLQETLAASHEQAVSLARASRVSRLVRDARAARRRRTAERAAAAMRGEAGGGGRGRVGAARRTCTTDAILSGYPERLRALRFRRIILV